MFGIDAYKFLFKLIRYLDKTYCQPVFQPRPTYPAGPYPPTYGQPPYAGPQGVNGAHPPYGVYGTPSTSAPTSPVVPGAITGPYHPQNSDMMHATDQHYQQLRAQAQKEGDLMGKCFSDSKKAYNKGEGARAHDLSEEGKRHEQQRDFLNKQASDWIFSANNQSSPRGTIDLHGLYTKEALDRVELAIQQAKRDGQMELRFIVGKGNHSPHHIAKIKPAVQELMQREHIRAELDRKNTGVLLVHLWTPAGYSREINGSELMDQEETCHIQ